MTIDKKSVSGSTRHFGSEYWRGLDAARQAKARLDAWAIAGSCEVVGTSYSQCAAKGYAYEDSLIKSIADGVRAIVVDRLEEVEPDADLGVVLLQAGDDLSGLYTWELRDAPSEQAFRVLSYVVDALSVAGGVSSFNPPDLDVGEAAIVRVTRRLPALQRPMHYTAVVVTIKHPCARACTLIVPAEWL